MRETANCPGGARDFFPGAEEKPGRRLRVCMPALESPMYNPSGPAILMSRAFRRRGEELSAACSIYLAIYSLASTTRALRAGESHKFRISSRGFSTYRGRGEIRFLDAQARLNERARGLLYRDARRN